jgi:outer membrane protein assembly factor BamB
MLQCLNIKDGARKWNVDCLKEFGASKGFFGRACSPLVEGDAVILNVGGANGASIIAFNKDTGKVLWKTGNDEPSYSSPVAATFGGKRMVVMLTRTHFAALDLKDGKPAFITSFRPPIPSSVTAANPIVQGDKMFVSASYSLGSFLYRFKEGKPEELWASNDAMSLQYSTAVLREGFLYGLHGRHDFAGGTVLRCVEFDTGKVRWSKEDLGGANLLLAGDQVMVLTENGELIRAKASPDSYQETGRAQILGRGVRAHPALADGLYYARDKTKLVCIDLRATK